MFYYLQILCPVCPTVYNKKHKPTDATKLELIESNYSGCGVDIAECPQCKKVFQISYKVDEINEVHSYT